MNEDHRRTSLSIAIVLAAMLAAPACHSNRGPERTVRRFFRAMNEKDVNQLLACVDPRQERMFRATFRLLEKATGFPIDDFFEIVPGLHQAFGAGAAEDLQFSKVRVRSRKVTGSTARVVVSVRATHRSQGRETSTVEEIEFLLEEFDEAGWRIIGLHERAHTRA